MSEDTREPLADAQAEVAAESAAPASAEDADEKRVPTLADQRVYPNGAADILLQFVEDDEDDGEEPEEGAEVDDDPPPPPVLIRVPRPQKWPDEAMDCLRDGLSSRWAELVLSKTSLTKWRRFAPTRDEANDFLNRWTDLTGQSEGKSRRYRRSLKAARSR